MNAAVKSLLKPVFSRLPEGVQYWIRTKRNHGTRKNVAAVLNGQRLVPEAALERKYVEALDYLTATGTPVAELGDYLEFGVYNGSSLACAYRALKPIGAQHVRLFGFDSFEGLPAEAETDDEGVWGPGDYSMDYSFTRRFLTQQGVSWDRVTLVRGFFNETLNDALLEKHAIRKASIVMVDCDMYLSAKTALSFCAPLLADRAVVLFDDWFSGGLAEKNLGEKRAFDEFLAEHPEFTSQEFGGYGPNSQVFVVSRV